MRIYQLTPPHHMKEIVGYCAICSDPLLAHECYENEVGGLRGLLYCSAECAELGCANWARNIPTPGAYVLAVDVENPEPDRRCSRDWTKAPLWKAGTTVYFRRFCDRIQVDMGGTDYMTDEAEGFKLLAKCAVRVNADARTVDMALNEIEPKGYRAAVGILEGLVSLGKLTLSDLRLGNAEADRLADVADAAMAKKRTEINARIAAAELAAGEGI